MNQKHYRGNRTAKRKCQCWNKQTRERALPANYKTLTKSSQMYKQITKLVQKRHSLKCQVKSSQVECARWRANDTHEWDAELCRTLLALSREAAIGLGSVARDSVLEPD
jgi:hypothetical protein